MLLQRLNEYADRLDLPSVLYSESPVRYIIELGPAGKLLSPDPVDTADPGSPRSKRGQRRLVPQVQRSSGIRPLLLADKADYVLGYASDPARTTRVQACHQAFLVQLGRCAETTGEPTVAAVLHFLSDRPLDVLKLGAGFDPGGVITFRVDGVFPIDLLAVKEFWAEENRADAEGATILQCLICGREGPVLERLQGKIKGVPGGADVRNLDHLGKRRSLRILRPEGLAYRPHLRQLWRTIHEGAERPPVPPCEPDRPGRIGVCVLDPGAHGRLRFSRVPD